MFLVNKKSPRKEGFLKSELIWKFTSDLEPQCLGSFCSSSKQHYYACQSYEREPEIVVKISNDFLLLNFVFHRCCFLGFLIKELTGLEWYHIGKILSSAMDSFLLKRGDAKVLNYYVILTNKGICAILLTVLAH